MEAWVSAFWMDSNEASICCCAACHWVNTDANWVAAVPRQASCSALRLATMPPVASLIEAIDAETAALEDWIRSGST